MEATHERIWRIEESAALHMVIVREMWPIFARLVAVYEIRKNG